MSNISKKCEGCTHFCEILYVHPALHHNWDLSGAASSLNGSRISKASLMSSRRLCPALPLYIIAYRKGRNKITFNHFHLLIQGGQHYRAYLEFHWHNTGLFNLSVLTKRDELSFFTVFAFPNDSRMGLACKSWRSNSPWKQQQQIRILQQSLATKWKWRSN